MRRGDRQDFVITGRQSEKVDRNDPRRFEPEAFGGGDAGLEARRVHVEGVFEHIDENRDRIEPGDDFGGRRKCEGRYEDRLARLEAFRHQREPQRIGAVGAGQHVLGAAKGGKLLLESADLGAHDVFAMIDHTQDRLVDPPPEAPALRAQIDELDRSVGGLQHCSVGHQTISSMRSGPASR